jgi:hypothetical protein
MKVADPSGCAVLRHESAATRVLGLQVRISLGGMDVCLLWVFGFVRSSSLRRPVYEWHVFPFVSLQGNLSPLHP